MLVRLDNIDHALVPAGPLDNTTLPKVPVIRIFGPSSTGKRACLHVHQVYPYFFVEYEWSLSSEQVNRYISKFTRSLNHAIAISLRRNPTSEGARYIRAVFLVKGVPFYGFHTGYRPFLKVLVIDPTYLSRAVTILQSGSILQTRFTTYESHLSYYLQFMSDFGLYGCGWVQLGVFYQRDAESAEVVHAPPSPYFIQSRMPLELDVCAHQIMNRHALQPRNLHTRLRIPEPPAGPEPLVQSVRELWEDERRRRIARGLSASPVMPSIISDNSRGAGGDWVDLPRLGEIVAARCAADQSLYEEQDTAWEAWVMTTFESVQALWEREWRTWRATDNEGADQTSPFVDGSWDVPAEIDVDEAMLSSQELDHFADEREAMVGEDVEVEEPEVDHDAEDIPQPDLQALTDSHAGPEPLANLDSEQNALPSHNLQNRDAALSPSPQPILQTSAEFSGSRRSNTDPILTESTSKSSQATSKSSQKTTGNAGRLTGLGSFPTSSGSFSHPATDDEKRPAKRRRVEVLSESSLFSADKGTDVSPLSDALSTRALQYSLPPPGVASLLESVPTLGMSYREYRDPFYGAAEDVPKRPREYAGLIFDLTRGPGAGGLEPWEGGESNEKVENGDMTKGQGAKRVMLDATGVSGWEYVGWAPKWKKTQEWLAQERKGVEAGKHKRIKQGEEFQRQKSGTQLEGRTQRNIYGFSETPPEHPAEGREKQDMTILSLEVFAESKSRNLPNPAQDEIIAAFYSYQAGDGNRCTSIIIVGSEILDARTTRQADEIIVVDSELDLLNQTLDRVIELDPDIVAGWEIQAASWGYIQARGHTYGLDVGDAICRAPMRMGGGDTSTFKVVGRHALNVWRLMRVELSLNMYSFENVAFHLLRRRVPRYTAATLNGWFFGPIPSQTARVLRYFIERTSMVLEMLDVSEVVTRTAEFARVFGVDFFSVLSRGSQFKVESFMFRIAKPESFVLISPNKADVGKQNAAECMPLIMEPYSAFYKGPIVVLDFQSLYPSIMIAYNYCYSTCLGRVQNFKGQNKFGVTALDNPPGILGAVKEHISISPNGMIFVKPEVRRGLLGRMLVELLDTRVMVKQAMKSARGDKALLRVLDARQLGLKYIANVTYGYASATFSGRMPAVEVADAIVQSGRETLEKAIDLIESTTKWRARVVYGDTDSVFIYLPGRTKEQAFQIGNEIANNVTALNPAPIKLKFEKVYLPCVLIAKKRYVGFKYERPDDIEPVFDAKGIETVRRDGVPAQSKMVERSLKILFRSQDLSEVKEYCQTSWKRIIDGSVSLQDFIFAKEVRLGTYSDKVPPPPGAAVAARRVVRDANDEPQYGERVPYIITRGEPGQNLVDRAVTPDEFLQNSKHVDTDYYITRVLIPPLERIFNLVGADVRSWYNRMMKVTISDAAEVAPGSPEKAPIIKSEEDRDDETVAIDSLYRSSQCILCGSHTEEVVCKRCRLLPEESLHALQRRIHDAEQRLSFAHNVCASCSSSPQVEEIKCESIDCPWRFARHRVALELDALHGVPELVEAIDNMALKVAGEESEDGPYT